MDVFEGALPPGAGGPGAAAQEAGGGGWAAGGAGGRQQDEEAPPSPFIAAIKPPRLSERPILQLHAWPGMPGEAEVPPQQLPPPRTWRRALHGLAGSAAVAASAAAGAATRLLPCLSRPSGATRLTERTRSMEVLSAPGREQSAPYLPTSKQPLRGAAALGLGDNTRERAAARWQRACQAVADAQETARCLDLLDNRLAPADDRLHAAVLLAQRLSDYPRRRWRALVAALQAQRGAGSMTWWDHAINELYITGERLFGFFMPPPMGGHRPYFISLLLAVLVLLYFFMAGQYGQYQAVTDPAAAACLAAMNRNGTAPAWGPGAMVRWIAPRERQWCFGANRVGRFNAQYLIDWGARWAPKMRSRPQRWLTSALLHQSFSHLLSNCLLLALLGAPMEGKHGTWRIALLAVLSALGGNLLRQDAVTEAPCVAVVGASGVVFGMAGVTVADMVANFETLSRPLLRAAVLVAFLVFFAVTVGTTESGTSHMSHVGGFLGGLLPALALLPNLHRGRAETVAAVLGVAGTAAMLSALPCIFYLRQLPRLSCGR